MDFTVLVIVVWLGLLTFTSEADGRTTTAPLRSDDTDADSREDGSPTPLSRVTRRPDAAHAPQSNSDKSRAPHVVFVLADDLGYNDVGWHNPWIRTPHLDMLATTGVRLENYYVQPICTPTRSQLLSGRYQIHTGLQHQIIWWAQANALPLGHPTLAETMRAAGYSTHMVGKWHIGFYKPEYLPVNRGFDSYLGFLTGSEDHLTHETCYKQWCGFDMRDGANPAPEWHGQYSTHVYTQRAVDIISKHNATQPLFLYLAYQAPHEPLEVPSSYLEQYPNITDPNRRTFAGMVTCVDEGVKNVTSALQDSGMWDNTVFIFSSGWKGSMWEGGMRAAGFVHSPLLETHVQGTKTFELLHVTDWYPTLQKLAGGEDVQGLDGYDQWNEGRSQRTEILHNIDPLFGPVGDRLYNNTFDTRVRAAIRVGDYKLITGDPSNGSWVAPPESGWPSELPEDADRKNVWLFNLRLDPSEHNDLSNQRPDLVRQLLDRLLHYNATAVPCRYPPDDPRADPKLHGGFWGPWEADDVIDELGVVMVFAQWQFHCPLPDSVLATTSQPIRHVSELVEIPAMFFTAEDDEQDFLSGGGGSKLASVFGMDRASSQGGNESLTYTAPKQPKKKEAGGGEAAAATAVTFATVVQAYKFVDNQYASQGKVGAAILANHASHDYRILLYYNKQQQLTNAKISPAFSFNVQANNYANFYDDARINWSVMFNNAQDAERFAKEVGLAKALSVGGQPDGVVQQDLRLGEGGGLETGDSVEARYTGWLLTNNAFGQVFDSNISSGKLFRFKVGKGKVIKGWDTGMLGMKKGSKRLLVIPPSLAYGSQGMADRIPANATLIFEVEVVRVKLQKGDATPEPPAQPPSTVTAPVAVPSEEPAADHDETVKERTRSISEQLSHSPKTDKAKLISRMAKMGQPMLPNMAGAVPAQLDSEEEPPSPQPGTAKPHLAAKPHLTHPAQPAQPYPAQPGMQQQMHMAGQPMAAHPMAAQPMANQAMAQPYAQQMGQMINPAAMGGIQTLPTQSIPMAGLNMGQPTHLSDPMAPMLLSETRQQTTEVRLTVSKMSDKVDRILEKVEALSSVGAMQQQSLPAPSMETSILLHNISRIVQENERLKKDVFEKGDKIESQNEKIAELLQKNQRYVEKSNTLLEERNEGYKLTANQSQSRILALEQEKVQMATDLSNASSRLASLQLELGELRKTEGELRQRLQSTSSGSLEQKEELDRLRLQRAEDEKKLTDLTASLREEKAARKQTESQLTAIQEELADLKATNSTLERQEIQTLREKLRKQRTSTDVETADKVAKMEEELAAEWQAKCDKMVAAAADKHARQLAAVKDDLRESQERVVSLEAKIQQLRSSTGSTDTKLADLQQQVEENAGFKEKYEHLRSQATAMKQKYEERIGELEEEAETMAAQQKESEAVKEVMASTTGHVTGDKGNPYYTRELDSTMVEEKMVSAKDHVTGDKGNPYYTKTLDATSRTGVEEPMTASAGHVTGDKGNPYYSKTLDATSGTGGEEALQFVVEEPMTASAGHVTGDKGNPYYSRTLDATSKTSVEEPMTVSAGHVTGDKGNPYYSRTLDATSRPGVEEPMKVIAGHVTGDRGNPYHSKTLDATSRAT
ncbi:hypothetical protein BaRGS_00003659, partial [Batillaria attramentaria]